MEKGIFVKDIKLHMQIRGLFAVQMASLAQTRKGEPYWTITLVDASGSIEARMWSPLSSEFESIPAGDLALAAGRADEYRGVAQLNIDDFELLGSLAQSGLDLSEFMPASPCNINAMDNRLRLTLMSEFTHPAWRQFMTSVFDSPEIAALFRSMPAAKNIHHAYAGGLLEHTLNVFDLCRLLADRYPELDRQTLLAGALLHDIGKIREFSGGIANDYTQPGRLLGHIFLGLELIAPFIEASSLPEAQREHLRHLILSHHGEPEYGAPVKPQTAEAFALHYADNIDARLAQCRSLFTGQQSRPAWSGWQKTLDRAILLPEPTPADDSPPAGETSGQPQWEPGYLESLQEYPDEFMPEPEAGIAEEPAPARKAPDSSAKDRQCSLL